MKFNSTKNIYEYPKEQKFTKFRIDNQTDLEVVLDMVLCRDTVVVTIKKVFVD